MLGWPSAGRQPERITHQPQISSATDEPPLEWKLNRAEGEAHAAESRV
jgi:hypothetical protein